MTHLRRRHLTSPHRPHAAIRPRLYRPCPSRPTRSRRRSAATRARVPPPLTHAPHLTCPLRCHVVIRQHPLHSRRHLHRLYQQSRHRLRDLVRLSLLLSLVSLAYFLLASIPPRPRPRHLLLPPRFLRPHLAPSNPLALLRALPPQASTSLFLPFPLAGTLPLMLSLAPPLPCDLHCLELCSRYDCTSRPVAPPLHPMFLSSLFP